MSDQMERHTAMIVGLLRDSYQDAKAENKRLKDENAELREQIHWLKKGEVLHVFTDLEFEERQKYEHEMKASIKALDDENKQLRELLRDTLIHPDQYCDKYGIEREYGANKWNKVNDDIDRRLRELGFAEVGE